MVGPAAATVSGSVTGPGVSAAASRSGAPGATAGAGVAAAAGGSGLTALLGLAGAVVVVTPAPDLFVPAPATGAAATRSVVVVVGSEFSISSGWTEPGSVVVVDHVVVVVGRAVVVVVGGAVVVVVGGPVAGPATRTRPWKSVPPASDQRRSWYRKAPASRTITQRVFGIT